MASAGGEHWVIQSSLAPLTPSTGWNSFLSRARQTFSRSALVSTRKLESWLLQEEMQASLLASPLMSISEASIIVDTRCFTVSASPSLRSCRGNSTLERASFATLVQELSSEFTTVIYVLSFWNGMTHTQ